MAFAELSLQAPNLVGAPLISIMNTTATQGAYRLAYNKFSPPIPVKRLSLLRKALPYPDLEWDLTINIHGYSAADAYQKLADLVEILMLTPSWLDTNDPTYIVRLNYKPNGSIYGSNAAGAGPYYMLTEIKDIKLPSNFEDTGSTFVLLGLQIKFSTYGAAFLDPSFFLSTDKVDTGVSPITTLTKQVLTFPTKHNTDSPYLLTFDGVLGTATLTKDSGAIFSTNASNKLYLDRAVGTLSTLGPRWSTLADAAGNYPPHNLARYTPTAPNTFDIGYGLNSGATPASSNVDVWIMYRVNTAGRTFKIRFGKLLVEGAGWLLQSPTNPVPLIANVPTLQYIGKIGNISNVQDIAYEASVDSISGGPTLDLMSIIFLVDDQYANTLFFSTVNNKGWAGSGITLDPNPLQSKYPFVSNTFFSTGEAFSYDGSAYPLIYGDTVATALVLPRGAAWRMYRGAPDNVVQTFDVRAQRYRALISPK